MNSTTDTLITETTRGTRPSKLALVAIADLPEDGIGASTLWACVQPIPMAMGHQLDEVVIVAETITAYAARKGHLSIGSVAQLADVLGLDMGKRLDDGSIQAEYLIIEADPEIPGKPCVIWSPATMAFAQLLRYIETTSTLGSEGYHWHALPVEDALEDDPRVPSPVFDPVDFQRWHASKPQADEDGIYWLTITLCAKRDGVTRMPSSTRGGLWDTLSRIFDRLAAKPADEDTSYANGDRNMGTPPLAD